MPSFSAGDHRWALGVRRVGVADFFAPTAEREVVLAERARWLNDDANRYAQLLPNGEAPLEETIGLLKLDVGGATAEARLLELGRRCEADLVWLRRDMGGAWVVVGGAVCFPSEWALEEKLGRPLDEVHAPVPRLNDELAPRIDAFLAGFDAGHGWARFNWSLAADAERNHHPARRLPKITDSTSLDAIHVRWEHQLLVRLPQSDAILFAIGIELQPLTTVKADAAEAARLAHLLETMSPAVASYKSLAQARTKIIAYLQS